MAGQPGGNVDCLLCDITANGEAAHTAKAQSVRGGTGDDGKMYAFSVHGYAVTNFSRMLRIRFVRTLCHHVSCLLGSLVMLPFQRPYVSFKILRQVLRCQARNACRAKMTWRLR